jgi:hypothetical protein
VASKRQAEKKAGFIVLRETAIVTRRSGCLIVFANRFGVIGD